MEIEDGVRHHLGLWRWRDGVQAFADFGIDNLIELIKFYKGNPGLLRRQPRGLRRMGTLSLTVSRPPGAWTPKHRLIGK